MDSNISQNDNKKLGFYLSFKRNEREIYEQIKSVNNYTQVIKELIKDYLMDQKHNNLKNHNQKSTIHLSIDDLCQIIYSVNLSKNNVIQYETKEMYNSNISSNSTEIPEEMLDGL